MQALVLNGFHRGEPAPSTLNEVLTGELARSGYEVTTVPLTDVPTSSCRGDFGCWVKTPGE